MCLVNKYIFQILKPLIKKRAIDFLNDTKYIQKNEYYLRDKITKLSNSNIGKKIGAEKSNNIKDFPLTGYAFYEDFFRNPNEGDFIYPLNDYVRAMTSGTMGKPKTFLLPRKGLKSNINLTGPSLFLIGTYDGNKSTLEADDVIYTNTPEGSYFTAHVKAAHGKGGTSFGKVVPPNANSMTFQQKVDYFIDHHSEIDIAYMTVTTLLEEVYPEIGTEIPLKAFFTQDLSAGPLKERIKKITGGYPRTVFGSTESMMSNLPSLEHPGGFLFDWRVIYPEFIPEKERVEVNIVTQEAPEILTLDEVEVGKCYQFIATPFYNDMTRYVMPDIFECIDSGDDLLNSETPVFKYHSRADQLLVLHNFTRINEEEIIDAMVLADIPFVDFTIRKEMDGSREYMGLYVELSSDISESEITERLNSVLMENDKDWRDLVNFLKFVPIKVNKLAKGSVNRYLQNKDGVPRLARIDLREELFNELLKV